MYCHLTPAYSFIATDAMINLFVYYHLLIHLHSILYQNKTFRSINNKQDPCWIPSPFSSTWYSPMRSNQVCMVNQRGGSCSLLQKSNSNSVFFVVCSLQRGLQCRGVPSGPAGELPTRQLRDPGPTDCRRVLYSSY